MPRGNETLAHLPKDEAGRPERAPGNSPPDVTEATVSAAENMTIPITASEAGQRNACDVWARQTDLTEEATPRETGRRAVPTRANESRLRATQLQNAFLPPNA